MAQQKQKYDKQLSDLRSKVSHLQTIVDTSKQEAATLKQSLSSEKPSTRHQFSKIHTDTANSTHAIGTTAVGSAKASRSINSMNRQMSKNQIGTGGAQTGTRHNGSQIMITNSQAKTPVGAQLSTGVTSGS